MADLIERLTGDPENSGSRSNLYSMKNEVARDLEALLNTRSEASRLIPAAFTECRKSSLTYGILDFSSYSLLNPHDRDRIRRSLEQSIGLHETRLSRVRVTLDEQRPHERIVRFRVDALLSLGSDKEKVQFDATLQLLTQAYAVS